MTYKPSCHDETRSRRLALFERKVKRSKEKIQVIDLRIGVVADILIGKTRMKRRNKTVQAGGKGKSKIIEHLYRLSESQ